MLRGGLGWVDWVPRPFQNNSLIIWKILFYFYFFWEGGIYFKTKPFQKEISADRKSRRSDLARPSSGLRAAWGL